MIETLAQNAPWFAPVAAHVFLLFRLFHLGLASRYRALITLQCASLLQGIVLFAVRSNQEAYFRLYTGLNVVVWCFFYLVLFELYGNVLRGFPGIHRLGYWLIRLSALASLGVIIGPWLSSVLDQFSGFAFRSLSDFILAQRVVMMSLTMFSGLLFGLLVWYPIRLNRNAVVYCAAYFIFFFSKTAALLLVSGTARTSPVLNLTLISVGVACQIFLAVFLRRESEEPQIQLSQQWSPSKQKNLVDQLNTLNQSLTELTTRS